MVWKDGKPGNFSHISYEVPTSFANMCTCSIICSFIFLCPILPCGDEYALA